MTPVYIGLRSSPARMMHGSVAHDGEDRYRIEVAALLDELRKIDAAAVDARRRACFQAPLRQL
jgi:hypothetical protein